VSVTPNSDWRRWSKDIVINCVEGGRQIETDEDSDLLVIGRSVHSVEDLQQRCFRRVSFPVR